ncbi:MAG: hypothetical protein B2I17_05115 [Thermoplasmatales archaeon B_DKE]|nr:MAG: hypothetical protein B2I17_05115 [Thermoplasmatales archaeon B_DKE]
MGKSGVMVKVCGITREEDALKARDMGADIIGLVFSDKSPRAAEKSLVQRIRDHSIPVAGVYTSMDDIIRNYSGEDYVQMHFPHTFSDIVKIREATSSRVISVIQYESLEQTKRLIREYGEAGSDIILIENRAGIVKIIGSLNQFVKSHEVGLAGKISISNIREVMESKPSIIDLSSSIESSPGIKDHEKLSGFFSEIRRYA